MLFFTKYLPRPLKVVGRNKDSPKQEQEGENKIDMLLPCVNELSEACISGCFSSLVEPSTKSRPAATTARISRSNFAKSTSSFLFPNTRFTNHESLPSLPAAFASFAAVYPQYSETEQADRIRDNEYYHLSSHVCLDYTGISLFSYAQMQSSMASSSSDPQASANLQPPFFSISYKSTSLKSQVKYGNPETGLESAIRKRIMQFLNILDDEYSMVCTASRSAAFRLLAESYPFHTNKRLLTVYDYESEAVNAMAECAQKRGAKVKSASFTWPSLRIHSAGLAKKLSKRNKKRRGLFVFPLLSRMTGARYPYLWMRIAQENCWHVVLDACALGPKEMDTFGLSLIKPDFIVCSFFKVFGENPSGFAGFFIRKSRIAVLETSIITRSIGIVSIVQARRLSQLTDDYSGTDLDPESSRIQLEEDDVRTTSSFSGPMTTQVCGGFADTLNELNGSASDQRQKQVKMSEQAETSEIQEEEKVEPSSEIVELIEGSSVQELKATINSKEVDKSMEIECRGLNHADSLGLPHISNRLRCITNWLVIALMKLKHPHSENGHSLVRIYGPRIKFERGPALAFNVFDWKKDKIEPALVQKLADRNNISLSCGFLQNIWIPDKYEEKDKVLERRIAETAVVSNKRKVSTNLGIYVVNASLGFLTNFEDAYRLWTFVAKFLDADFVEKERWRYMALNQKMVEV